jgi:hypothetical protein
VQEYVNELGFQLQEKNPDIQVCYMDLRPALTTTSFLELFTASLFKSFPEVTSKTEIYDNGMDRLKLPSLIAQKNKIRVAVFIANSHLFHRFRDEFSFLRLLKLMLRNQKNSIFCLYGNSNQNFRELIKYPGPLSGLGQLFELNHNPLNHRSACIRKLFHDCKKKIGYTTSVHMSYAMDNHPFYLKLLAWHALIRTRHTCTLSVIDEAMNDLIHHFELHFYKTVESLTSRQLSLLKALMEGNKKLYSEATREAYHLGSTSSIVSIKLSLEKKGILDTKNGDIAIIDPIFREWLRRFYFTEL